MFFYPVISTAWVAANISKSPEYSEFMTASRLVKEMDAGPLYNSAVRFGLDCSCASLMDDRFRDEAEQRIVIPLEEHLKFYCGKDTIEACLC